MGRQLVTDQLLEAECGQPGKLKTPGDSIRAEPSHFYEIYQVLTVNIREKSLILWAGPKYPF